MAHTPPSDPAPNPDDPPGARGRDAAEPDPGVAAVRQGVVRQRDHIIALTGEDPLRGGIAD